MENACFIVNTVMAKIIRLGKIMIASGRKVLVKKMKALTVIRRSYLRRQKHRCVGVDIGKTDLLFNGVQVPS